MQQKLAQILSRIIKIAEEFNVAIYMTNQGLLYSRREAILLLVALT